jgi:iron complex outermembrane receptor protein
VGDTGGAGSRIHHGPITAGTDTEYQTRTEREAFAVYTQSVWQMTDRFALTTGLRWALDRVDGYESAFFYDESLLFPLTSNPATSPLALNLATYNFLARLDPNEPVRLVGVPTSVSLWRQRELEDEGLTWRVNLDFEPNDDTLLYASVTTGHRSAGMNLALFSSQAEYEGEDLMAYELGYKGSMFDSTLQVNGSVYYYDYEEIHSVVDVPSALSANGTSSSVLPIPGAEILGVEVDGIWLATDALTLGANFSYTPSEYTESFFVIDNYDPFLPQSLVASVDRQIDVDGNQLPRVPEMKGGAWGSYVFDFGSSGSFETLLTFTWIDDVYFSVFEQEEDKAPAYSRWDIRGTWSSSDEAWMVAAFVNNVLDEIGVRQIDRGTEDDNWLRKGAVTDPRLYGLELRYRFGAL